MFLRNVVNHFNSDAASSQKNEVLKLYIIYYIIIIIIIISSMKGLFLFSVALRPNAGHGLILEVSISHTTTHHSR